MTTTPYPIDPVLSAIAIAYRNDDYIADRVLPRVPVERQEFRYATYAVEETFRRPDTRVGRRGRVNEVVLTADTVISSTSDYGLEDPIPHPDIQQAQSAGMEDPTGHATMQLADYIMLDREVRTAATVFDPAQYPSGFKVQLTSNDQWDVAHADSDPIDDILTGMSAMLMRANRMAIGQSAWLKLRTHPKMVKAVHGNDGDTGIVTREQVARLFELEEVLVGQSRLNTAAYGQAAVLASVWGPHCLLFHQNRNADTQRGLTFGYTAEYLHRVTGAIEDQYIGLRGGTRIRVGESVKELITASRAAYFIEDVVSQ